MAKQKRNMRMANRAARGTRKTSVVHVVKYLRARGRWERQLCVSSGYHQSWSAGWSRKDHALFMQALDCSTGDSAESAN